MSRPVIKLIAEYYFEVSHSLKQHSADDPTPYSSKIPDARRRRSRQNLLLVHLRPKQNPAFL